MMATPGFRATQRLSARPSASRGSLPTPALLSGRAPRCCPTYRNASLREELPEEEAGPILPDSAAYYEATLRLEALLKEAELSNKDTVPVDILDSLNAEERLTLCSNLGTLGILAACLLCLVFSDVEALHGLAPTAHSVDAALLGAGYALPLMLCSIASRARPLRQAFPVLDDMHASQADLFGHLTKGMDACQQALLLVFLVMPVLLLLLPASTAAVAWAGQFAGTALLQTWGSLHAPPLHLGPLGKLLPALLGSYWAGLLASSCFGVRPRHIEVLRDALAPGRAEAFFRLARASPRRRPAAAAAPRVSAPPPPPGHAPAVFALSTLAEDAAAPEADAPAAGPPGPSGAATAAAFRALAMAWLLSRRRVARLAYVLAALDAAYLSLTWQSTGNLATPAAAALLHAAAECWLGGREGGGGGGPAEAPAVAKRGQ